MAIPLKLYVNPAWLIPGRRYIPLLYPHFGFLENKNTPWTSGAWKDHGYDGQFFSYVDRIEDADYVVVPHDYYEITNSFPDAFGVIEKEAEKAGKQLLANNTGDVPGPHLKNGTVLRAADYRFCPRGDAVIVPYSVEDLVEKYCNGVFEVRKKTSIPSVGFVGWTKISFRSRLKVYALEMNFRIRGIFDKRYLAKTKGIFWRVKALKIFSKTSGVRVSAIERPVFGARKDLVDLANDMQAWRRDFISSLKDCDYALCVKGDENASFRFYEALSMGRIPLLLDTECVLPLENEIDYRSFCVIVNYRDINRIGEKLLEFHKNVKPEEFEAMQQRARSAFVNYLRMDSFSEPLARMLRDKTFSNV